MNAGRQLDALVAEKVMGDVPVYGHFTGHISLCVLGLYFGISWDGIP